VTTTQRPGPDDNWGALVADWQAGPSGHSLGASIATMRRRVNAHRRTMIWVVGLEIIASMVAFAATLRLVRSGGGPLMWLVSVECWLLILGMWWYVLWNRRGTWRPLADSTEAFIALARLRCVRRLRTVWLIVGLVVAQVAIVTIAILAGWGAQAPIAGKFGVLAWRVPALVAVLGYLACAAWLRHTTLKELDQLDRLHEAMRL
jgi:hypothetical protein